MARRTVDAGRAIVSHWPKETTGPSGKEICEILAKAKFGGVPTSVEMPPIEHEYPMPSITPVENPFVSLGRNCFSSSRITDKPMGSIMVAVAVFEIHIDRKAEASMKPSTILSGPPPTVAIIVNAIRRCRFHFCITRAMMNPPIKSTMVLLK